MAKKSKPTREFSPRAMRIYKIAQRGVASRSNQQSVLRAIDREIETIKAGNSDPQMKEEIINLKGQVTDADKVLKEHVGVVSELEKKHKDVINKVAGEAAEWKSGYEKLQGEYHKVSLENDERGLEISHLMEQIAELNSAGSDPAKTPEDIKSDSGDPAETPGDSNPG